MTSPRRLWRTTWFLFSAGFRAAPMWMALDTLDIVVRGASSAITPYGLKLFIDGAVTHANSPVIAGVLVMSGSAALNALTTQLMALLGNIVQQRTDLFLTLRIAELVNEVPGIEHFERPEYLRELDLLQLRRRQLASAPTAVLQLVYVLVRTVIMLVLLVSVNPLFALVPLLAVLPFFTNAFGIAHRQRADNAIAEQMRLANDLFTLASTAAPAKELRLFGLAPELEARHRALVRELVSSSDRSGLVAMLVGVGGWLVFAAGFVACLTAVIVQAAHGHVSVGQLVMTIALVQQVQVQLSGVTRSAGGLQQAKQAADRYVWLELFAADEAKDEGHLPVPGRIERGIALDHVSFAYPGTDVTVLDDLSLFMPAGSTVALIGENGAGKTTLAKLLAGLYRPSGGSILIDGTDLADMDRAQWREGISATFQDFANFELRAGDSVGIGDLPRLGDAAAAMSALERSGAGGVVDELDLGLDTLLGKSNPGGRELSGGQWQKVALGRGRIRDAPILLLLDEPTASLDAPTEHALFEYYVRAARDAALQSGAITVIVSHRFSTVRMADLVVVLANGSIEEIGDHDALMGSGGLYSELFTLQARGYR